MSSDSLLPGPAKSFAVLIGVSSYAYLEPLPMVARNLSQLAMLFCDQSRWGLPRENCTILPEPTSAGELCLAIERAASQATDTLIVYYAGHGLIDPDEDQEDDLYLALPGTQVGRTHHTAVRFSAVRREILRARHVRRRVVIVDSCYSGLVLKQKMGTSVGAEIAQMLDIDGTCVLSSTSRTRPALAHGEKGLTAFTGELVNLLSAGVQDGSELLDMDTIFYKIRQSLRSKQRPVPERTQSGNAGRIALGRNPAHPSFVTTKMRDADSERAALAVRLRDTEEMLHALQAQHALLLNRWDQEQKWRTTLEFGIADVRSSLEHNQTKAETARALLAFSREQLDREREATELKAAELRSEVADVRAAAAAARQEGELEGRDLARRLDSLQMTREGLERELGLIQVRVNEGREREEPARAAGSSGAGAGVGTERCAIRKNQLVTLRRDMKSLRSTNAGTKEQIRLAEDQATGIIARARAEAERIKEEGQWRPLLIIRRHLGRIGIRVMVWAVLIAFVTTYLMYSLIAWGGLFRS